MSAVTERTARFIVTVGEPEDIAAICRHAEHVLIGKELSKTYAAFFKALKNTRLPGWFWAEYHFQHQMDTLDQFENQLAIAVNEMKGGRV